MADGGEGTAEVLARTLGGEWLTATVSDPLGRPVTARWLLLPDGTAVVESAEAVGLGLLARRASATRWSPRAPASDGCCSRCRMPGLPRCSVCVGGTATVDGGAGLREVLPRWPGEVPLRVLCDVRNPLLGQRGAARVFGPQKGAGPEAVDGARAPACGDSRSSRPTASCRARAPAAGSALRSRRSAASSPRAPRSCSS